MWRSPVSWEGSWLADFDLSSTEKSMILIWEWAAVGKIYLVEESENQ